MISFKNFISRIVILTRSWIIAKEPLLGQNVASSANYSFSSGNTGNLKLNLNGDSIILDNQPSLAATSQSTSLALMDIGFDFWFMGVRYSQLTPIVRGAVALGGMPPYTTTPVPTV